MGTTIKSIDLNSDFGQRIADAQTAHPDHKSFVEYAAKDDIDKPIFTSGENIYAAYTALRRKMQERYGDKIPENATIKHISPDREDFSADIHDWGGLSLTTLIGWMLRDRSPYKDGAQKTGWWSFKPLEDCEIWEIEAAETHIPGNHLEILFRTTEIRIISSRRE